MTINLNPFSTYNKCSNYITNSKINNTTIFLISTTGGYVYKEKDQFFDETGHIDGNVLKMIKPFLEKTVPSKPPLRVISDND